MVKCKEVHKSSENITHTHTHTLCRLPFPPDPIWGEKYHYWTLKHSGNEAPFKANEAALAAYERAISKPPPSAAGVCWTGYM